jgi:dTDP-4-dehydrorhamnose reductase
VRRVLITGGSGQIGTALRRSAPPNVSVVAPGSAELDIANRHQVAAAFESIEPDLVINSAAYTAVDKAESEPDHAFAVNAVGAQNIAIACSARAIPMCHLSTDYVFDGTKGAPYVETDAPAPANVYGASKLEGERRIAAVLDDHLILRVSWVFGSTGANFVRTMLSLATRAEIRVVDDQFGAPCAAADIAQCIWRIDSMWDGTQSGIFHFSSAPETTWYRFANVIFAEAMARGIISRIPKILPIPSSEYPQRVERPKYSLLDSGKLALEFGVVPEDWVKSLGNVLNELRSDASV